MKKMKRFLVALLSCLTAVACVAGISACGEDEKKDSSAPAASSSSEVVNSSSEVVDSSEVADSSSEVVDSSSEEAHVCEFPVVESLAATCEEDGYTIYGACECGAEPEVAEVVVPALGHEYTLVDAKAPTCTEWGWADYLGCDRCGLGDPTLVFDEYLPGRPEPVWFKDVAVSEYVAAYEQWVKEFEIYEAAYDKWFAGLAAFKPLGHDFSVDVAEDPATCLESGVAAHKTCSHCGITDGNDTVIDALGHTELTEKTPAVEAKCDADGFTAVMGCDRCSYTEGGVNLGKDANNHSNKVTVAAQAATCTAIGWAEYEKCDACTYTTYKEEAALGHNMVLVAEGKAPSCAAEANGYTAHTKCDRENCGYEVTSVAVNFEHTWNAADATCTEDKFCTVCKKVDVTAYGHNYATNVTNVTATCYQEGLVVNKCACGAVEVLTTGKTEHTWAAFVETEVTCYSGITKAGALKCTVCADAGVETYANSTEKTVNGNTVVTVTPASNKTAVYVSGKAPVAHAKLDTWTDATCLTASLNNECKYCGVEQESFKKAAYGHQFSTAPTCLTDGKCTRATCDIGREDGVNYTVVPAYNHEYTVHTPANKFATGAVLGTAWVDVAAKAATCTAAGYDAHKVCYLCKDFADANGNMTADIGVNENNSQITIDVGTPNMSLTSTSCYFYVAPIGHDYKAVEGKIATCKEAGYTAYEKCSVCGNEKGYTTINKTSHASSWTGSCLDKVVCDCSTPSSPIDGWTGCGEYFTNTKKGACVMNDDGYCVVCGECEHNILKDICPTCKKEEI